MMFYIFGWMEGQAQGGMGDFLAYHRTRDAALDHLDYAARSLDHVQVIEFVGTSWKRIAGYDRER